MDPIPSVIVNCDGTIQCTKKEGYQDPVNMSFMQGI